jgi:hypothetical protein
LQRIRLRQDTEENWLKNDPVPASGELCYTIGTTDPGQVLKVGDGTVRWSNLPYLAATGASGPPGAHGLDGHGITVYGPSDSPPSPINTQLYDGDMWLSNGMWAKNPNFDPALITPGAKGDSGEIVGVSAVPLPTGQNPTVNNTGTTTDANLIFGIPAGAVGPQGIQGPIGPAGIQGPAGDTFKVSGAVANAAALPAAPANLAVFITQDDSHLHIYDTASAAAGANGYVDLGAIAGPQGQPTFYSNPVATAADLPATGAAGQCILALDTGHMHSWNPATTAWVDAGQIRGPSGAGISDGTADGQVPVWSVTFGAWQPTSLAFGIPDWSDKDWPAGSVVRAHSEQARGHRLRLYRATQDIATGSLDPMHTQPHVELGKVENAIAGQTYRVLTGGNAASYTAKAGDTVTDVRDGIVKAINDHAYMGHAHAVPQGTDSFRLIGDTSGVVLTANSIPVVDPALGSVVSVSFTTVQNAVGSFWEDITPEISLDDLTNIDTLHRYPADGDILIYNNSRGEWEANPLHVSALGGLDVSQQEDGTALEDADILHYDLASQTWKAIGIRDYLKDEVELSNIGDCTIVGGSTPSDGEVLTWDGTAGVWRNAAIPFTPIIFLGTGAWNAANVASEADNYGMPADTVPNPVAYPPSPGDQYIDLATGNITAFTGPTTRTNTSRSGSLITGGTSPVDRIPQTTRELADVEDVAPTMNQVLVFNQTSGKWTPADPPTTSASPLGELWLVGDIKESVLTEPQFKSLLSSAEQLKWALADGRDVTGSLYAATTGRNTIPDLRGAYLRMAGLNNTNAAWNGGSLNGYQEDSTARPKNTFSGSTSTNGVHSHTFTLNRHPAARSDDAYPYNPGGANHDGPERTDNAGSHNHSVTITAGGDTETRPKTYSVNYFIKIN